METLKEITEKIRFIKTNIDGLTYFCDYLTLTDLYNISEAKIEEICLQYNLTNFELPKISGYNSLVIYADSIMEYKIYKYAIKIHIFEKNDIEIFNTIKNIYIYHSHQSVWIFFTSNML